MRCIQMQDLTLGAIGGGLVFLIGFIAAWKSLKNAMKENLEELLEDKFDSIDENLDAVNKKLTRVGLGSCKNYIVPFLAFVERGGSPSEVERQRFWDAYEAYTENGGNTYIQDRVARLQKKGLL